MFTCKSVQRLNKTANRIHNIIIYYIDIKSKKTRGLTLSKFFRYRCLKFSKIVKNYLMEKFCKKIKLFD